MRMGAAEEYLPGTTVKAGDREEAARMVSNALEPMSDIHASARYRKDVGGVMVRRALEQALVRTEGEAAA